MSNSPESFELKSDGVQLVVNVASGTPVVLHWGSDLGGNLDSTQLNIAMQEGVPHADLDAFQNPGVWRENARGFLGRPALQGHRAGQDWSQMFEIVEVKTSANTIFVRSADQAAGLEVAVNFEITNSGILRISQSLKNLGSTAFALNDLTTFLPLPDYAAETVDFTGRWVKERQPQRREIQVGTWAREIREGRSGHDYTITQIALNHSTYFRTKDFRCCLHQYIEQNHFRLLYQFFAVR